MQLFAVKDISVPISGAGSSVAFEVAGAKSVSVQCIITATSPTGATVGLLKSNDGVNFDAVATATAISATGHIWLEDKDPTYKYVKLTYVVGGGTVASVNKVIIKAYK